MSCLLVGAWHTPERSLEDIRRLEGGLKTPPQPWSLGPIARRTRSKWNSNGTVGEWQNQVELRPVSAPVGRLARSFQEFGFHPQVRLCRCRLFPECNLRPGQAHGLARRTIPSPAKLHADMEMESSSQPLSSLSVCQRHKSADAEHVPTVNTANQRSHNWSRWIKDLIEHRKLGWACLRLTVVTARERSFRAGLAKSAQSSPVQPSPAVSTLFDAQQGARHELGNTSCIAVSLPPSVTKEVAEREREAAGV